MQFAMTVRAVNDPSRREIRAITGAHRTLTSNATENENRLGFMRIQHIQVVERDVFARTKPQIPVGIHPILLCT